MLRKNYAQMVSLVLIKGNTLFLLRTEQNLDLFPGFSRHSPMAFQQDTQTFSFIFQQLQIIHNKRTRNNARTHDFEPKDGIFAKSR